MFRHAFGLCLIKHRLGCIYRLCIYRLQFAVKKKLSGRHRTSSKKRRHHFWQSVRFGTPPPMLNLVEHTVRALYCTAVWDRTEDTTSSIYVTFWQRRCFCVWTPPLTCICAWAVELFFYWGSDSWTRRERLRGGLQQTATPGDKPRLSLHVR